ncbi:hypothetical protein [Proteus mirabilis]|uniref:hypothetical protein n=1 Tax=Proteus mirabilis TaxID=584 RepID=UPI0034D4E781
MEKLDINTMMDKYIAYNDFKQVTSTYIFSADNSLDPEGIFSTEIFGRVGSNDRKIRFGWIDLKRRFIQPFIYNQILQMFRNLPSLVSGEKFAIVDPKTKGIKIVPESTEGAGTGIDFLYDNWDKIVWNTNDSSSREKKEVVFDTLKRDDVFINKFLVIPAYYRDINVHNKSSGKVNIDEINTFYLKLISASNSEMITFSMAYNVQSTVQTTLVEIHDYLTTKPAGKKGIIRNAIMGKTVDYAAVNVISAPHFDSNRFDHQMIPFNYIGVPLYLICAIFFPLIVKQLEDMFFDIGQSTYFTLNRQENVLEVDEFTFQKIDTESLRKLVSTYVKDKTKTIRTAEFKLSDSAGGEIKRFALGKERKFTVTDLLFMAACDVVFNRYTLSTRFPITDSGSQIFCKVKILTTETTIDLSDKTTGHTKEYYRNYPDLPHDANGNIIESEVKWIDTLVPNNSFLASLGGDFDGFVQILIDFD